MSLRTPIVTLAWLFAACGEEPTSPAPSGGSTSTAGRASAGVSGSSAESGGNAGTTVYGGAPPSGGTAPSGGSERGGSQAVAGTSSAGGAGDTGGRAGSMNGGTPGVPSGGGGAAGRAGGGGNMPSAGREGCDAANLDATSPPTTLTLSGNLGTHDPVLIFAHDQYYLFATGDGLGAKTSADLRDWKAAPAVFAQNPSWIANQVPGATNLWAPDISHFGGSYHLYYSASTFGSNRSCIGHATRAALNTRSWSDHGSVMCSNPDGGTSDDFNAIDPNVILDRQGTPWLAFGSFWGGLKLMQLDESGARANSTLHAIAARPRNEGALEAPFIVWRCGYYYLFASFDTCCKGVDSTYKIMVGRSEAVTGPYLDRQGVAMMEGGGTLVLQGSTRWRGPGHNAVIFASGAAYNVYHAYDAENSGNPVLRISELAWDMQGWPVSGGP